LIRPHSSDADQDQAGLAFVVPLSTFGTRSLARRTTLRAAVSDVLLTIGNIIGTDDVPFRPLSPSGYIVATTIARCLASCDGAPDFARMTAMLTPRLARHDRFVPRCLCDVAAADRRRKSGAGLSTDA
jgi:hypothetical protein